MMSELGDMMNQALKARDEIIKELLEAHGKAIKAQRPNLSTEKPTKWSLDVLMSIEWKRFEEFCKEYIKAHGWDAQLTQIGADGGVDIEIYQNGKIYGLVQCKAWITKIGVKELRELYGVMASRKITDGTFFTTSSYTQEAFTFAQENKIDLHDSESLMNGIEKLTTEQQQHLLKVATIGDYTTPTCPNCNIKMVVKFARNTRGEFWGCINFPRCRNTIQMRRNYFM